MQFSGALYTEFNYTNCPVCTMVNCLFGLTVQSVKVTTKKVHSRHHYIDRAFQDDMSECKKYFASLCIAIHCAVGSIQGATYSCKCLVFSGKF